MGWLASLFTLIGLLLNAQKVRASWLLWVAGNFLWISHAWATDWSVVVLNIVFVFVNFYGYKKWRPYAPTLLQTARAIAEIESRLKARHVVCYRPTPAEAADLEAAPDHRSYEQWRYDANHQI